MALTMASKMTGQEKTLHEELTRELENTNAALIDAQSERNRLTQEIEGYVREAQRLARHKALLEQEVERRHENGLWVREEPCSW